MSNVQYPRSPKPWLSSGMYFSCLHFCFCLIRLTIIQPLFNIRGIGLANQPLLGVVLPWFYPFKASDVFSLSRAKGATPKKKWEFKWLRWIFNSKRWVSTCFNYKIKTSFSNENVVTNPKKWIWIRTKGNANQHPWGIWPRRKKCWRMLALTKKTRFAGSESFQTWGYPKMGDD